MTSIYAHLRAHLPAEGPGLTDGGERLPDEQEDPGGLRWAPGALDGVMGHHAGGGGADGRPASILARLEKASTTRWRRDAARRALYDELRDGDVLSIIDDVIERVTDPVRHHATAQWLTRDGEHREPVKFGIALLGLASTDADLDVLRVLGRHEEFTLYAAVALARTSPDPEGALWGLAENIEGWGRIQIVERLAGTQRPEIKDWLLRKGFRNSVMYEYTAFIAATTGDLVAALEAGVDHELRTAAVDILRALIAGGPAEDIGDYAEGPLALELVLAQIESAPGGPAEGMLVVEAEQVLADAARLPHWTPEIRAELAAACRRILTDPTWGGVVESGLASEDTFFDAEQLATALGIDAFPAILARLHRDPFDAVWFQATRNLDEARLGELLSVADAHFRPEVLGPGPAEEFGFGPMFAKHSALEHFVTALAAYPGVGWPHVRTALSSPVIRSRNMALRTLDTWGPDAWPDDTRAVLEDAAAREPRDDVRASIERLLTGQPLAEH